MIVNLTDSSNSTPNPPREVPQDLTHAALIEIALDYSASATLVLRAVNDSTGRLTTFATELVNRRAETVLGLSRANALNHSIAEWLPNEPGPALLQAATQAIQTGQPSSFESAYVYPPTNQRIWFEISVQPVGDGQRVVVSLTNITPPKPAELAEQSDLLLFETLASKVPQMGVLVVDRAGIINLATGLIPGLLSERRPKALTGQSLVEQIMPDYRPDWERYLATVLEGESHFFSDHWNAWRCECYVGPVSNPAGAVVGGLIVFRNVTEEYHQQQALQSLNQALQQSNEQLEQFAYVASHDLREPLRKIQLFSSLIGERAADRLESTDQDLLNRMQSAAHRLDEMIDALLLQAQFDGPSPARTLINLTDLLSTVVGDLTVSIQEQAAIIELVPPMPSVSGDVPQLRQLFLNLLTNALKFVEPGVAPRIHIRARLVEGEGLPDLSLRTDTQYAEISVVDNGIGIPAQHIERIFGLFNRLHGRHQYAGTGIGLATVKKIVDNHQGRIAVSSQEGVGTIFRVYLPVAPAVAPT